MLTCFPILFITTTGKAQERKFADISFQLNEVTKEIFIAEIEAIEKSNFLNDKFITKFAATLPIIEPILKEANLPDDFKFLSIYHNSFKEPFESGIFWGITETSAQNLNLTTSNQIDERKHLVKATQAATKRIALDQKENSNWAKTLCSQLSDKELAINLTTHWENNTILIDNPGQLDLIRFLAFKSFIETQFIRLGNLEHTMIYQYKSGSGRTFAELSEKLNLDIHEIINDNQWLTQGKIPANYPVFLYLPISRYYEIKQIEDSEGLNPDMELGFPIVIPNQALSKGLGGTFYTINGIPGIQAEMGDKFINLAYKSDISHKKFLEFNDMQPMDDVFIGHIYYLKEKKSKANIPYHIAKQDETLWAISQQYGVKLGKLLHFNHLDGITKLNPGQLIWMQEKRPKNEAIQYFPLNNQKLEKVNQELLSVKTSQPPPKLENIASSQEIVHIIPVKTFEPVKETFSAQTEERILQDVDTAEDEIAITKKKFLVHNVEQGDTIASISRRYDVSIKQLVTLNNLTSSIIEIGDKIIVKRN